MASVIGTAALIVTSICYGEDFDPTLASQPKYGWRQIWAGVDITGDSWLAYSGVTVAPWSESVHGDGLRLRAAAGYGHYAYSGERIGVASHFNVDVTFLDALIGYQLRYGPLIGKAFAGVSSIDHRFDHFDPDTAVAGPEFGAKGVIELWLNVGDAGWTSLDLSFTTAHDTGSVRWRGGWRVLPDLSIGPELRFDVNAQDNGSRAGGFVRYEIFGGEISAAAGWGGAIIGGDAADDLAPYATLSIMTSF